MARRKFEREKVTDRLLRYCTTPRQREVLEVLREESDSATKAAQRLGMTKGAVCNFKRRAVARRDKDQP